MKDKVWRIGTWIVLLLGLCTVCSIQIQRIMLPEVTVISGRKAAKDYNADGWTESVVVPSCVVVTQGDGTRGVFSLEKRKGLLWEETYVVFSPVTVTGEFETCIVIQSEKKLFVHYSSQPLKDGESVRIVE